MNIQIVGLQKEELIEHVKKTYAGTFTVVEKDAEVMICYGGDGTLLWGERMYPGIPKVMIRNSRIFEEQMIANRDLILRLLAEKKYTIAEHMKLEAEAGGKKKLALNDVVIGNPHVNGSIRFRCTINDRAYDQELLADGILVSTPVGSTGYFQSITNTNFEIGLGVAFNNAMNHINHLVLNKHAIVSVEITRGPARLAWDNDEEQIDLSTGDLVTIYGSKTTAKAVLFPKEFGHVNLNIGMNRTPLAFR